MAEQHTLRVIARIHSDFPTKFGIPRQSGLVEELRSAVVFEPEYRNPDALRDWRAFLTSGSSGSSPRRCGKTGPLRCAPRALGGMPAWGCLPPVLPSAPTPLACPASGWSGSSSIPSGGPALWVAGADLMDGTPIYDVKPYLPYADCRPEAAGALPASPRRPASGWSVPGAAGAGGGGAPGRPAGGAGPGSAPHLSARPGPGVRSCLRRLGGEVHCGGGCAHRPGDLPPAAGALSRGTDRSI